ncbi:MAG: response regulator [Pseudomonadota bacterium]
MTNTPRILVVEDDIEIRSLLKDYLQREGFRVDAVESGTAFDRLMTQYGEPDLIVLDLMLPGEDGLSICRRVRASSEVPIIILTARGEDIDRIVGLEIGADDYLPKPFNPRELLARIRAILRRAQAPAPSETQSFHVGSLTVDLSARKVVTGDGQTIELTGAEFDLLACFIERPGRVLSRDQLMDWTRGRRADVFDRTIDVQVSRLRKKISVDDEEMIKTSRGAGYILTAPVSEV